MFGFRLPQDHSLPITDPRLPRTKHRSLPLLVAVLIALLAGYLCGSIPFGFLAGKLNGIDVRDHGSGNIGATNVFRTLGKKYGIPVFFLDVLKGIAPVLVAGWCLGARGHLADEVEILQIVTAVATILGHNFTCWLNFKGGKGIATSAGAIAAVVPWALLAAVVVFVVLLLSTRYVSIGSLGAAVTLPSAVLLTWAVTSHLSMSHLVFTSIACVLAFWRHKSNIRNLLAGTENRFRRKTEKAGAPEQNSEDAKQD